MNCYYHQSKPAVGICKNCQKGICPDCIADVGNGLACKNSCETQVLEINTFFEQGKSQFQRIESSYKLTTIWMGVFGGVMTLLAIIRFFLYPRLVFANVMLLVLGFSMLAYAYKNRKNDKSSS